MRNCRDLSIFRVVAIDVHQNSRLGFMRRQTERRVVDPMIVSFREMIGRDHRGEPLSGVDAFEVTSVLSGRG